MTNAALARFFDRIILFFQMLLVVGIPLFFNAFTRSVFEVNKLMWMRVGILIILMLWATKYLLLWGQRQGGKDEVDPKDKFKKKIKKKDSAQPEAALEISETTTPKKWFWFRPSGIEWVLVVWCLVNLLSTLFSANYHTALIGAYDRWEGIFTVFDYVLLTIIFIYCITSQRQFFFVLGSVMVATFSTAVYGVSQSMGYDFMSWSSDPAQRIFASINNPVHYCAYVGMMVPVVSGWILLLSQKRGTRWGKVFIEVIVFTAILVAYYSLLFKYNWDSAIIEKVQFLWIGMGIIAVLLGGLAWAMGSQGTLYGIMVIIFHAQVLSYSRATWLGFFAAMIFFFIFACKNFLPKSGTRVLMTDVFLTIFIVAIFFMYYLFNVYKITWLLGVPMVFLFGLYAWFLWRMFKDPRQVALRLAIIFGFSELQHITQGMGHFFLFFAVGALIFALVWRQALGRSVRAWLVILYMTYGVVACLTVFPIMWAEFTGTKETLREMPMEFNLKSKIESVGTVAIEGSARSSMWKTSIRWWLDGPRNFLVGTGPDTVKYMYPIYRRADYGILEGGHNFTPDKVHNDYFNTLITRGLLGFVAFYFGLVVFFISAIVRSIDRYHDHPIRFLQAGLLAGSFVYLGQTFFNFGVVATLSLFFILMSLGTAVFYRPEALVEGQAELWPMKPFFKWKQMDRLHLYALPGVWLLTAFFVWQSVRPFNAERHYRASFNAHQMAEDGGRTDRFPLAAEEAMQAIARMPLETHFRVHLGKIYEDWYNRSDNDDEKKYLLAKAIDTYARCVQMEPENPWYLNRVATMYSLMNSHASDEELQRHNMAKAETLVVFAAGCDPNNPLFLINAGFFKHRLGRWDEALEYYHRALAIDNRLFDAWFNRADVLVRKGDYEKAKTAYAFIEQKDPSYNNLHNNLGRMYQDMGKPEEALREYAREVQINPGNVQAYVNSSYIHIDRHEWRGAIEDMQGALRADPGQLEVRYNLAVAYMNVGQYGAAQHELENVLQRSPGYERAQNTLAVLHRVVGR